MVKITKNIENTVQSVFGLGFHSSAMNGIVHDALWPSLLDEVRHSGAHAPNCAAIECDEHIERKLASTGSTQHVGDWVKSGRLFVEMSLMAAATAEREFVRDDNKKRCYITLDFDTRPYFDRGNRQS